MKFFNLTNEGPYIGVQDLKCLCLAACLRDFSVGPRRVRNFSQGKLSGDSMQSARLGFPDGVWDAHCFEQAHRGSCGSTQCIKTEILSHGRGKEKGSEGRGFKARGFERQGPKP